MAYFKRRDRYLQLCFFNSNAQKNIKEKKGFAGADLKLSWFCE
jgi:hypothetical protein